MADKKTKTKQKTKKDLAQKLTVKYDTSILIPLLTTLGALKWSPALSIKRKVAPFSKFIEF